MDAKRIIGFLRQLMANNNRPWFQEHKKEYEAVRAEFERGIVQAIERVTTFDPEVAHLQVKDCTYRFYRDTRFSPDKSPYKNHLDGILPRRTASVPSTGGMGDYRGLCAVGCDLLPLCGCL